MEHREVQAVLRKGHIVVVDEYARRRGEKAKFNGNMLLRLGNADRMLVLHGTCYPHETPAKNLTQSILDHTLSQDPADGHSRQRHGTLNDMLQASKKPNGKALNGLDFPRAELGDFPFHAFSSDFAAWSQTQGAPKCKDEYPCSHVRWGLCATRGANHHAHIDCEGGGTFVAPECGKKLWIMAVPAVGCTWEDFGHVELTLDGFLPNKRITWVALILEPGTTL